MIVISVEKFIYIEKNFTQIDSLPSKLESMRIKMQLGVMSKHQGKEHQKLFEYYKPALFDNPLISAGYFISA